MRFLERLATLRRPADQLRLKVARGDIVFGRVRRRFVSNVMGCRSAFLIHRPALYRIPQGPGRCIPDTPSKLLREPRWMGGASIEVFH